MILLNAGYLPPLCGRYAGHFAAIACRRYAAMRPYLPAVDTARFSKLPTRFM